MIFVHLYMMMFKPIFYFVNFNKYYFDKLRLYKAHTFILKLRNGIRIKLRSKKIEVSDIDIIEELIFNDLYEINAINNSDVIIDIGAHIGIFSLLAAKKAKSGKIYSFEPNPSNYSLFEENIHLNSIKNIISFNLSVAGESKNSILYISSNNSGGHSIIEPDLVTNFVSIKSTCLKEIFETNKLKKVNFVKMDCEGAEYDILINTPSEYLNKIDKLIIEQHITDQIVQKYDPNIIIEILKLNGFKVSTKGTFFYPKEGEFRILKCEKIKK